MTEPAMETRIALFRGINVGGRNILPMKDLREILAGIGCRDIQTYIQSGNVVFRSEAPISLADEIRDAVEVRFCFAPRVFVLDPVDLQAAMVQNPFPIEDGKALHFYFLHSVPEAFDQDRLTGLKSASESFAFGPHTFYLHAPEGIGRSRLAAQVERCLGVEATARNANTVRKLAAMCGLD